MSAIDRPLRQLVPGIPSGPNAAMYGIELEVENGHTLHREIRGPRSEAAKYWRSASDGSLRNNGIEFVLGHPSAIGVAKEALRAIYNEEAWGTVQSSIRTSTHIHVNAGYWSPQRLSNFMELCILVEPLLMQYVGRGREENVYCIPMYRAEDTAWGRLLGLCMDTDKSGTLQRAKQFKQAMSLSNKYSAINVQTLSKFGTIEFRMAPLYHNFADAKAWLQIIARTSNNAVVYRGGALDMYKRNGINELLRQVYGNAMQWWGNMDPEELIVTTDAGVMAEQMFGTGPVVFLPPRKPGVAANPRKPERRGVWGAEMEGATTTVAGDEIVRWASTRRAAIDGAEIEVHVVDF